MEFRPRPKQAEVLAYRGGYMGVSAVPGSGKTWTLSVLASELIASGRLSAGQEILIVTLVNSAVDNFSRRINSFIEQRGMLPKVGYRVRTLHGLAHDIVRERPGLVDLADDFRIIDEREAIRIRNEVSRAWLKSNPYALDAYLDASNAGTENYRDWLRREKLPEMVSRISLAFIKVAKDNEQTPGQLEARLERSPIALPLARMGLDIYAGYQRALAYRGAVDFDDLIRLALHALSVDPQYLARLRERWPFVLEDEAQDSSLLQENILRELAGRGGNWVRVGDPNQAIFETFTTANPEHLRHFIANEADFERELPNSGRSSQSVIDLANYLIEWTGSDHPNLRARDALDLPLILPAPAGDPQPNPPDNPAGIRLIEEEFSAAEELQYVAESVVSWLVQNPDRTAAVLVPRNVRGFHLVDELRQMGVEAVDSLLQSTSTTRRAAGALANILQYLSDPKSAKRLARVYQVWRRGDRDDEEAYEQIQQISDLIKKIQYVEDYLAPGGDRDWLASLVHDGYPAGLIDHLREFRAVVKRWQGAVLLPIDQLILTLAQDLFDNSTELAIAHKLAVTLGRNLGDHPDWRLPEMTGSLAEIAKNERRFLGFSDDDLGFDPEKYKGRVVVSTMHKAKGLEWDRVYLMSVNNYNYPSGEVYDQFISEKKFIRDGLNLEAEALAELQSMISAGPAGLYREGAASEESRTNYVRERLRLLYVGITRAKEELVVSWNTGRQGDSRPAIALVALQAFARERGYGKE